MQVPSPMRYINGDPVSLFRRQMFRVANGRVAPFYFWCHYASVIAASLEPSERHEHLLRDLADRQQSQPLYLLSTALRQAVNGEKKQQEHHADSRHSTGSRR